MMVGAVSAVNAAVVANGAGGGPLPTWAAICLGVGAALLFVLVVWALVHLVRTRT